MFEELPQRKVVSTEYYMALSALADLVKMDWVLNTECVAPQCIAMGAAVH